MLFFIAMVLLFIGVTIRAIYNNIQSIKALRTIKIYKQANFIIAEKVIPERLIEPSSWIVTSILDVGRISLGILIIFIMCVRSQTDSIFLNDKASSTLHTVSFLCFPFIWIAGEFFGLTLSRGIQDYFSKERFVAFSEQGILYIGKVFVWNHFRGYTVSSEGKYIYLLSKYYPSAIGFSFAPTSPEDFNRVIGEIKKHLTICEWNSPNHLVSLFGNIYFQAAISSLLLFLIGLVIASTMPAEFGIIINSIMMYLHGLISVKIANRVIPTDKFLVAETENSFSPNSPF